MTQHSILSFLAVALFTCLTARAVQPIQGASSCGTDLTQLSTGRKKETRLPKPVDWIAGKLSESLHGHPHQGLHLRFLQRNKFNQLTLKNLASLERDLRAALEAEESPADRALLKFELATVLSQNRPGHGEAAEAERLVTDALAEPGFLSEFRVAATQVLEFTRELLAEPLAYRPLKQVNWAVSNRCPLCCKGCYFNFRLEKAAFEKAKLIAGKLKAEGVEEIILTGGDPLLAEDFLDYVDLLHSMGFKVAFDTTGYSLTEEMAKALSGKISFMGLPVDGATQDVVSTFRKGQDDTLEHVKTAIALANRYRIPVKINTTVTRYNVDNLMEIAALLEEGNYRVDWGWSLFQWWETRAEKQLIDELAVPDETFLAAATRLKKAHPKMNIRVGAVENRSRKYFEIMTDGDVLNYSDGAFPGSVILGNVLTDDIVDLVRSPALDKQSPKFLAWFPPVGKTPLNPQ